MRRGPLVLVIVAAISCGRPVAPDPVTTTTTSVATTTSTTTSTTSTSTTTTSIPNFRISRTKFLAFGDSVTAGEVTSPVTSKLVLVPSAAYPTVLQQMMSARYSQQTITMINAGQGGEAATDSTTLPRFYDQIVGHRPDVVLLLDGYNDLLGLGPFGIQEAGAAEAIRAMARDGRDRNARVFIATVTPNRPEGRRAIPTPLLQSFNSRLRSIAAVEGAVLVDLYSALAGDVNTYIGADGLHPTEAGYRKMAETFFAVIQATLETP